LILKAVTTLENIALVLPSIFMVVSDDLRRGKIEAKSLFVG
jgi:hypothetical protein